MSLIIEPRFDLIKSRNDKMGFPVCDGNEPGRDLRMHRLLGYMSKELGIATFDIKKELGLLSLCDYKGYLQSQWDDLKGFTDGIISLHDAWEFEGECSHEVIIFKSHRSFISFDI